MLLEVQNVSKKYSHGSNAFHAVNNVSLSVKAGEFAAISGYSGSGKSTLLNMISGLLKSDSGRILFEGRCISDNNFKLSDYRNNQIGYIIQGQSVLNSFTVLENVCLPYYISGGKENKKEEAMTLLKAVGLEEYAEVYPNHLSGGEMRRAAVARALINRPKLVIADEPTSNLDKENAVIVLELFKKITQSGVGVLISTHDSLYRDYADRCYTMEKGVLQEISKL
ncbi:MAG: ABC transporter ATP-binding protein [Oscillospiraceae bacterium]|nr:ABC transporter ATP-binding protein [Oscillospiraceae bacterium]